MTPEKLLGQQFGPYQIEAILGSGGMAVVYRARQADNTIVALKVLFPPPDAAAEIRLRFEREARTVARLRHPGIVRVLDAGHTNDYAYIAMIFVSGQTLADRLAQPDLFDETTAADIAWQVADALYYAHTQGVVHRDVKPSNILLDDDGRALLTDFGVAQALDDPTLTRTGHTVGTPAYMAPEQAGGQPVDGRADLYSLGVVLYQMIVGRTPFQGSTPQVLHAHVYKTPPPPSSIAQVSPAMEAIILQALQKNTSKRFQTGAAMAQALANFSDQTGTYAQLPVPPPQTKRGRRWFWAIITLLLVILAITLFVIWQFGSPNTNPPIAALDASPTSVSIDTIAIDTPTITPSNTPTPAPTNTPSSTPTKTSEPIVDALTATSTATPTSPPPATFTPTLPPPPPATATPTTLPTATSCSAPISPAFSNLVRDNPALSQLLGCPQNEGSPVASAWQPFERGTMLWRGDSNQIYVLQPNNIWSSTGDTWREGDPEPAAGDVPTGLHQPVRGFGKVWFEQPGVREALGWGTTPEAGFEALVQDFITGGQIWQDPELGNFFVLFNDRTYQEF